MEDELVDTGTLEVLEAAGLKGEELDRDDDLYLKITSVN